MKTGLVAAMAMAVAGASLAVPASDAGVRKALEGRYQEYGRAFLQKNPKLLIDVTTPDFLVKLPGGETISRRQRRRSSSGTRVRGMAPPSR